MADSPHITPAPEIPRPHGGNAFEITITVRDRYEFEDVIDALIDFLDRSDPDPDLEPSLGGSPYNSVSNGVDLEGDSSDDEPWLGWSEWGLIWGGCLEEYSSPKPDLELDDYDNEPSLGSPNVSLPAPLYGFFCGVSYSLFQRHRWKPAAPVYGNSPGFAQFLWGDGSGCGPEFVDREEQCEGEGEACEDAGADDTDLEPDNDGEPEPGWTECGCHGLEGEQSLGSLDQMTNQLRWAHGSQNDY